MARKLRTRKHEVVLNRSAGNRYFVDPRDEAYCGLMLTEMAFAAINSGIFALAYWSYVDHPDPYSCAYSSGKDEYARKWGEAERFFSPTTDDKYNKWGFLKWDDENGDYGARAPYWCVGPMVKFFRRNAKVLDIENTDENIRVCGVWNRDRSVTVGMVNRSKEPIAVTLSSDLFLKDVRVYEYEASHVPFNRFADLQDHAAVLPRNDVVYTLKPESVTYFTTDYITKERRVCADGIEVADGMIGWKAVDDENHCYYRVFTSDNADFVPSKENQIASTVGTSLPAKNAKKYIKVLSVDRSGNM